MSLQIDPVGRTALVTGAGSGIGRAVALALGQAGARVGLLGRRPDPLNRVAVELASANVETLSLPSDVTRDVEVTKALGLMEAALGPVEILVHAAGRAWSGPLQETDDATIDSLLAVNFRAAFILARAVAPAMQKNRWGRIITMASTAALRGYPYTALYTASKHALAGLTRSLSAELLPHGITVNAVCPGFVETELVTRAAARIAEKTGCEPAEARALLAKKNPLGRLVSPQEVAAAVLYLCGPHSGAISGHSLVVDGGTVP